MGWSEALKEAGEGYSSRAGKSYLSHGHGAAAGFARGLGGLNKEGGARISESMSNNIATGAMGAVGAAGVGAVAANAQNSPVGAGIGGVAMAGALGASMFMKPGAGLKAAGDALASAGKAAETPGIAAATEAAPARASRASSLMNKAVGTAATMGSSASSAIGGAIMSAKEAAGDLMNQTKQDMRAGFKKIRGDGSAPRFNKKTRDSINMVGTPTGNAGERKIS